MPSVKTVERQIGNREGFDVTIRHPDGRDARGDRRGLPGYAFERAARDAMTVADWKDRRFSQYYSGWEVDVLDANGDSVAGNTLLRTARESYED